MECLPRYFMLFAGVFGRIGLFFDFPSLLDGPGILSSGAILFDKLHGLRYNGLCRRFLAGNGVPRCLLVARIM